MKTMSMAVRVLAVVVLGAGLVSGAQAQTYPVRGVRIVVPYPPGGGNDLLGRRKSCPKNGDRTWRSTIAAARAA
jgi:tripartite-type tricarboxylate transporter receptor subunit TctC